MEEETHRTKPVARAQWVGLLLISALTVVMFGAASASASSLLEDLPTGLGEIIGAEDALYTGGAILSVVILGGIGIALGMAKLDISATLVVLLATMGALVVMGWLDFWLLVLVAIFVGVIFARTIAEGMGGKG